MLNTKSMECQMFAILGTVVTMKAALIYTVSLIWFVHGTSANTSQVLSEENRLVIAAYCHHSPGSNDPTSSYNFPIYPPFLIVPFSPYHRNQLINCCLYSRLSKRKRVTLCVTLLMGSQSFSDDPYPCFHPLSRQTAHDCP